MDNKDVNSYNIATYPPTTEQLLNNQGEQWQDSATGVAGNPDYQGYGSDQNNGQQATNYDPIEGNNPTTNQIEAANDLNQQIEEIKSKKETNEIRHQTDPKDEDQNKKDEDKNKKDDNDDEEKVARCNIDFSQEVVGIKIALQNKTNQFYAVSIKFYTDETNLHMFSNTNINKHIRGRIENDNILYLHKIDPKKPLGELILIVGYKEIDRDTYLDNASPVFAHVDGVHTVQLKLDKTLSENLAEEEDGDENRSSNQFSQPDFGKFSRQQSGISSEYNLLTEDQQMDMLIRKASFNNEKSENNNTTGENAETESNNDPNVNAQEETQPSSESQQQQVNSETETTENQVHLQEANLQKNSSVMYKGKVDGQESLDGVNLKRHESM